MKVCILAGMALIGLEMSGLPQEHARQDPARTNAAPPVSLTFTNKARPDGSYPVIGYLEQRDRVITIKSSPHGPVYSVATRDGKNLFENLSPEQLKAQAPEIHDLVKTGVAADARSRPVKVDASIYVLPR